MQGKLADRPGVIALGGHLLVARMTGIGAGDRLQLGDIQDRRQLRQEALEG